MGLGGAGFHTHSAGNGPGPQLKVGDLMPDDSLPGPPPLTQSTAAILSQAVEVASKHLRECQRAIEGDQHARARLAEEFARIAARPKPAPDWEPEELEAAARPRPIEGRPQKPRGLLGVMPLAWRDSCARLAEQLEGAGYAFQAGEVRRLVSSVPRPRPLAPEDVIPERNATAAAVKALLEVLRPLPKELAAASRKRHPRRRKRPPTTGRPLSEKQIEAMQIVGDCKGNLAEAARRLGKDPKTVRQHYNAALRKLGKAAVKHATRALPSDRRGQVNLSADDDRRR
jgi:DNA-binding CsgD family transcriptional regulator